MTTIAIDGTHIAADGLKIWGGEVMGLSHEKVRREWNGIYAMTGTAPYFDPLVKWHQSGADPEKAPKCSDDNSWALLFIDRLGSVTKYSSSCAYPEVFPTPIALGAGGEMATGAMLAKASAAEAVSIVAARTNHTGGEIQVIDIAEALGLSNLAEAAE